MTRFQKVARKSRRAFDALTRATSQLPEINETFFKIWTEQDSNAAVEFMTYIRYGQVRRLAKAYQRAQRAFSKQLTGQLGIPCKEWRIAGGKVVRNRPGDLAHFSVARAQDDPDWPGRSGVVLRNLLDP